MISWRVRILLSAALVCQAAVVFAHKSSDSYLSLNVAADSPRIAGRWDVALRDLEHAVGVDADADGAITWGELRSREAAVTAYAFSHLALERIEGDARAPCPLHLERMQADQHVDGGYAVLFFDADCPAAPAQLGVAYSLFFALDPDHRGLLKLQAGAAHQAAVFSPASSTQQLSVNAPRRLAQLRSFVEEGVSHILQGYDHVLFLLTLLLPAVVLYRNGEWTSQASLRNVVMDIVKVVTAFTLAHSLTLSAATLGFLNLPSRLVESSIALTVVLGALNNLWPVVTQRRWLVAFAFGLIHGVGFASVLQDLGLAQGNLAFALLGFNVGVEAGQLMIVAALAPVAFWLRASVFYRRVFMPSGAVAIGAIASYWFVVRAFDLAAPGS